MNFEHFALNVPDARAAASWYVEHLGLKVLRSRQEAPFTHFLADRSGRVFLELYTNPTDPIPLYPAQHPLRMHFAFAVTNADAEQARLLQAGATLALAEVLPDGSRLVMLRDPWGVPVQLCQRAQPF
jgi:glyoxylase I family protein